MTAKEFDLLYFLFSHKGQVFTKEQLYEYVWGYGRVGVVQIHPVFEELLHAFDTRPPIQRNEVE